MGQEQIVRAQRPLAAVLAALSNAGQPCQIVMVDSILVLPSAPAPATWSEVRLKTPAGMVTLRRRADEIALLVFGNATAELLALRETIAAAFATQR